MIASYCGECDCHLYRAPPVHEPHHLTTGIMAASDVAEMYRKVQQPDVFDSPNLLKG